uniref:Uncharacterized protein n=1 Tax=Schistocephalus solidus TaxID=70667 RepID=A0A0V0J5I8_SCHSO
MLMKFCIFLRRLGTWFNRQIRLAWTNLPDKQTGQRCNLPLDITSRAYVVQLPHNLRTLCKISQTTNVGVSLVKADLGRFTGLVVFGLQDGIGEFRSPELMFVLFGISFPVFI